MNINLTLIGQSITFLFFVWFCYAFVWRYIRNAMEEREKRIADGLEAADRADRDLEQANAGDLRSEDVDLIAQLEARTDAPPISLSEALRDPVHDQVGRGADQRAGPAEDRTVGQRNQQL